MWFSMMSSTRGEVLSLYRRIFRVARHWQSSSAETSVAMEQQYIRDEARRLFKKNKMLTDTQQIRQCLDEGRARLDIALHYQNPYPRLVNVAQNYVEASKFKKAQIRINKQSKPVYMHSQN